jgi:hypothetical protein
MILQTIRVAGTRAPVLLLRSDSPLSVQVFFAGVFSLRSLLGFSIMFKTGFSVAVLVTTAAICIGSCSNAVSQDAVSPPVAAPAKKKIVSAPVEPSAGPRASATQVNSATQVYLIRGFLNVFSLGMDSLALEIRRAGISATVAGYNDWQGVAAEIAANYKAGRRGPIVLIGHSFGADAVMFMADNLNQMGVPVALIIPFDGTYSHAAPANVARVLNLYRSNDVKITSGPGFHGELTNYYVSDAGVSHTTIDDSVRLHVMAINKIKSIRSSGPAASTSPKTSG